MLEIQSYMWEINRLLNKKDKREIENDGIFEDSHVIVDNLRTLSKRQLEAMGTNIKHVELYLIEVNQMENW